MPVLDRAPRFVLPPHLEAHEPPEARGLRRDEVRLLISDRRARTHEDARFADLPDVLRPGDLLVVNDSGTLPAEVTAQTTAGATLPLRFSTHLPSGLWSVEPRQSEVEAGETLTLPGGATATLLFPYKESSRLWVADVCLPQAHVPYLLRWGRPIRYSYVPREWPLEMYQTVYHGELGSAEMPSAGRPFSRPVLRRLAERGVGFARVTLHTGVSSLEAHEQPYEEWFRITPEAAATVNDTRAAGGRIIAAGTTVVRALESAPEVSGKLVPVESWTDLVITPERGVRVVDGLLTGFHEPEATHLDMLEAIAGREHVSAAYRAAVRGGYLWHEFGDSHLLV